jgi:hypothetical protein
MTLTASSVSVRAGAVVKETAGLRPTTALSEFATRVFKRNEKVE